MQSPAFHSIIGSTRGQLEKGWVNGFYFLFFYDLQNHDCTKDILEVPLSHACAVSIKVQYLYNAMNDEPRVRKTMCCSEG